MDCIWIRGSHDGGLFDSFCPAIMIPIIQSSPLLLLPFCRSRPSNLLYFACVSPLPCYLYGLYSFSTRMRRFLSSISVRLLKWMARGLFSCVKNGLKIQNYSPIASVFNVGFLLHLEKVGRIKIKIALKIFLYSPIWRSYARSRFYLSRSSVYHSLL